MLEGGCACGAVRYRLTSAPMFVHCCHCRDCQRQTGSAFVLNALIESDRVERLSEELEPVSVPTDSGRPHDIYRCPECRTAIWSDYGRRRVLLFVRVGTLDDPTVLAPDVHIYTRSKLPWVALPSGVPAFEAYYDPRKVWPAASLERRRALLGRSHGFTSEALMIDLYTWGTPNGRKASIALEELALPYKVHPIDIGKGDQFKPDYLAINPNGKIPAIVDPDGPDGKPISVFESGAILIYLAEKTGRLLPKDVRGRSVVIQWLVFQMGGVGPMFGQAHHFRRFAPEKIPYAVDRYTNETKRLYGVLDRRLAEADHLAGDYSIADIATYPWVSRHEWQGVALTEFPSVKRWFDALSARPAVARGMAVPKT